MEGLRGLGHLFVTMFIAGVGGFIAIPSITDVTMSALCPGQDECSLAIYLTGFQHAMIGVGSVVTTPLIGNLSDRYGRKVLITLPLTVSLIPQAILAYSRETKFFYAYYLVKTLAALAGEGSLHCLALAYVADKVPVGKRASAFGILAGVGSASFVGGTLAARFLSTALTFQVASVFSMIALVYMRIFLKESEPMRQPLLKEADEPCIQQCEDDMPQRTFKKLPSMGDVICLLKCSPTFSQAAIVLLFNSLADGGLMSILMYYLKARFQYNKNQFADLMMISGIGATLTQLFLMPILVPAVGEEKLLTTGLFVSCISILVHSIAWSAWVPYALAGFSVLGVLVRPTITSIASKQVGPNEQGMLQGCLSGVTSVANIISPLVFSPLTALFLSEDAPFNFPGFSLMCLGLILMTAFFLSLMIRAPPPIVGDKVSKNCCTETLV
ncbi:tetracycline resistance protein, class A-like [Trifolium pratense]|uniref:tetracycline resistance protein, class A-like n=1 Tax=Trifolium pratense TaxID=57577 RepID=UPI001E69572F|nr:tetracycline resistance protein, class A-like [Trifolium pratense]